VRWAYASGADAVEIDLWQIENELVLIHDRRANSYLPSNDLIINTSLLDLRSIMDVPSLQQVIGCVPQGKGFNIEIKDLRIAEDCLSKITTLVERGLIHWHQVLFSSFDHRLLQTIKQQQPLALIGLLEGGIHSDLVGYAKQQQADSVNMAIDFVDEPTIAELTMAGIAVYVYTVNHVDDALMLRSWGVSGIFCDDVANMKLALNNKES